MENAIITLEELEINTKSPTQAVQQVRQHIEGSVDPINAATVLIFNITDITVEFTDLPTALHVAQYVVYDAITLVSAVPQDVVDNAFKRTAILFEKQPWAKPMTSELAPQTEVAVAAGVETKVAIKSDGKIKKGGKQILAVELYKLHVVETETPVDNQGFIAILMKELGMTKAGATTYAYNCRKQFAK